MQVADWDGTENARVVGDDERRTRVWEWVVVVGCRASDDLVQKVEHRLHALTKDSRPHSVVVVAAAAAVSVVAAPPLTNDTALVFAVAEAAPGIKVPPPAVVAAGEDAPAVEPVAA
jgi:hypothetical protein